jgi:hypothetical protein
MFDDDKAVGQAPGNLPFAPEPAPSQTAPVENAPPDALDAGLLRRKVDVENSLPPAGHEMMNAPQQPSFVSSMPQMGAQQPMMSMGYTTKEPVLGKVLAGILTVVLIGVVGFGGWYGYVHIVQPLLKGKNGATPAASPVPPSTTGTSVPPPTAVVPNVAPIPTTSVQTQTNNDTILFGEQTDSDKDGLTDRRERELGTDPYKTDTDTDGLSDGDEVLIWGTDPLNPDTDGDGYKDGDEVKNGYNPLGPGKLFNVPTSTPTRSVPSTSSSATNNVPSL